LFKLPRLQAHKNNTQFGFGVLPETLDHGPRVDILANGNNTFDGFGKMVLKPIKGK
jgi:hypothetical protein